MWIEYKVELANKIRKGRAIGNLWGVGEYIGGCRRRYVLEPQESEETARDLVKGLSALPADLDDPRILRHVLAGSHRLLMWDTYKQGYMGKSILGYALFAPGSDVPIFAAEDFEAPATQSIDGDHVLRCLLGFLTLRPGDTDSDYFKDYSARQCAWRDQYAEDLSLYAMEADSEHDPEPFEDLEGPGPWGPGAANV